MPEQKRDPEEWRNYFWQCNRCNVIRTPLFGYCPRSVPCGLTLSERSAIEVTQINLF